MAWPQQDLFEFSQDLSGLGIVQANLAWQVGHCNPLRSTGVHVDYVGEGKTSNNESPLLSKTNSAGTKHE